MTATNQTLIDGITALAGYHDRSRILILPYQDDDNKSDAFRWNNNTSRISCSSIYVDAKAMPIGVEHAKNLVFLSPWIESDSLVLINAFRDLTDLPSSVSYIFCNIKICLKDFQELHISHIC